MNEDPGAPNYDPQAQDHPQPVQRQPRPAAAQGDRRSTGPATRSRSRTASASATASAATHEMLAHFKDYNDIVGDHPQNLLATDAGR